VILVSESISCDLRNCLDLIQSWFVPRLRIYHFVGGLTDRLKDILSVYALNRKLDIPRIREYAQQFEKEQHNREVESERDQCKRAKMADQYQGSGGASIS